MNIFNIYMYIINYQLMPLLPKNAKDETLVAQRRVLKTLLAKSPQYGANEEAIDGDKNTGIRYLRITDIDELGRLKKESGLLKLKLTG